MEIHMVKNTLSVFAVLVLLVGGAVLIGGCTDTASTNEVKVIMPYLPSSEYLPYYTAINKNYYEDEGLNVTMLYTTEGGFGAIKQVAAGNAQFGMAGGESIVLARSHGIPVTAVYQLFNEDLYSIITLKSSNITRPQDLVGKSVGITGAGGPLDISAQSILKNSGVDLNSVTFVPVGGSSLEMLASGQVDAIGGFVVFEEILKLQGIEYNVMYAKDYDASYAGCAVLFTTEELIQKNPDLVKKFVKATDEGMKYAIAHPEESVDAYIANFNPDSKDNRGFELDYWNRLVNETILPDVYSPLGQFDEEQWEFTQNDMLELGIIMKRTDEDLFYTQQFVPTS